MRVFWKIFNVSRWLSPVTIHEAAPETAARNNASSDGSSGMTGCGSGRTGTNSARVSNFSTISSGECSSAARRRANRSYLLTRFNSSNNSADATSVNFFSDNNCTILLGGPSQRNPETSILVSRTTRIFHFPSFFSLISRLTSCTISSISSKVGWSGSGISLAHSHIGFRIGLRRSMSPLVPTMNSEPGLHMLLHSTGSLSIRSFPSLAVSIGTPLSFSGQDTQSHRKTPVTGHRGGFSDLSSKYMLGIRKRLVSNVHVSHHPPLPGTGVVPGLVEAGPG